MMGELNAADGDSGELDGDAVAGESAEDDGLEAVLTRRSPRRRRILQLASVLVALGIVVGLVANSLVPLQSLPALLAPATATPDPSLISTVLVTRSVTWGTLTLNGRVVAGSVRGHVTLRPGDNTLTLTAPPFLPRVCHITAPIHVKPGRVAASGSCSVGFASGDGCPPTATPEECVGGQYRQVIIDIGPSADDLPPDLRRGAVTYLRQTLSNLAQFTTSVPQGQYVATSFDPASHTIHSQRAAAPLTAELTVAADVRDSTDGAPAGASGYGYASDCATLHCPVHTGPFDTVQLPPNWGLAIPEILTWRFTSASGALIGSVAIEATEFLTVYLAYDDQAGWQLVGPRPVIGEAGISSGLCIAGAQLLAVTQPAGYTVGTGGSGRPLRGIEGCALQLRASDGTSQGLVVWRFGVLLAADAATQKLLPNLPLAPPDEVKAVSGYPISPSLRAWVEALPTARRARRRSALPPCAGRSRRSPAAWSAGSAASAAESAPASLRRSRPSAPGS